MFVIFVIVPLITINSLTKTGGIFDADEEGRVRVETSRRSRHARNRSLNGRLMTGMQIANPPRRPKAKIITDRQGRERKQTKRSAGLRE